MSRFSERTQCKDCEYNDENRRLNDEPCCTSGGWTTNVDRTAEGDPVCLKRKVK